MKMKTLYIYVIIIFIIFDTNDSVSARIRPVVAGPVCADDGVSKGCRKTIALKRKSHKPLVDYARRQSRRLSELLPSGKRAITKNKILLFDVGRTGLADRLLGMISAFVLAFVTDRTLLVKFGEPIDNIEMLFENPGWEWTLSHNDFVNPSEKGDLPLNHHQIKSFDLLWKVFLTDEAAQAILCKNLTNEFGDVPILHVGSSEFWLPLLATNPFFKSVIKENFGENVVQTVSDFLLFPVVNLRNAIELYLSAIPDDAFVLSMHIRIGHSEMDEVNASGYVEGWYKPNVDTFIDCAHQILGNQISRPVATFVATDNWEAQTKVERALNEAFGAKVIYTVKEFDSSGKLVSTNKSKTVEQGQYTRQAFESALVDYWLIGEADKIIVSTMSSVASFAPGRTSVPPIVSTGDGQCISIPPHRTQPCFHLLAKNLRTNIIDPGKYDLGSLCPDHSSSVHALTVRRRSAFYHSESMKYTCVTYFDDS